MLYSIPGCMLVIIMTRAHGAQIRTRSSASGIALTITCLGRQSLTGPILLTYDGAIYMLIEVHAFRYVHQATVAC